MSHWLAAMVFDQTVLRSLLGEWIVCPSAFVSVYFRVTVKTTPILTPQKRKPSVQKLHGVARQQIISISVIAPAECYPIRQCLLRERSSEQQDTPSPP